MLNALKQDKLADIEDKRKSLLAQLDGLGNEIAFINALPDELSTLVPSKDVKFSVGKDWLKDAALTLTAERTERLHSLLELLPAEQMALYESSTFCFAPATRAEEVTQNRRASLVVHGGVSGGLLNKSCCS